MGLGALVCLKICAPFHIPIMRSCISLNTLAFSLSVRLKQSKNEISLSIILSISFLFIIQIFISTLIAHKLARIRKHLCSQITYYVRIFFALWVYSIFLCDVHSTMGYLMLICVSKVFAIRGYTKNDASGIVLGKG